MEVSCTPHNDLVISGTILLPYMQSIILHAERVPKEKVAELMSAVEDIEDKLVAPCSVVIGARKVQWLQDYGLMQC